MAAEEMVVCFNCGAEVELSKADGWISLVPWTRPGCVDGVASALLRYYEPSALLPTVDPGAVCYCPECALHVEIEKRLDDLGIDPGKNKETAMAVMRRQDLVRAARSHVVYRVLQLNYGTYYDEVAQRSYGSWSDMRPVLRDLDGDRAKVRVEILDGTTKEEAVAQLAEAIETLRAEYEKLAQWPAGDTKSEEPAADVENDIPF